jgi:hypothetical protein
MKNRRSFDDVTFFENYKFFINLETHEIEIKFVCDYCKKLMTREEIGSHYAYSTSNLNGAPMFEKAIFWCDDCDNKLKNKNNNIFNLKEIYRSDTTEKKTNDTIENIYKAMYSNLGVSKTILSQSQIGNKIINKDRDDSIDAKITALKYLDTRTMSDIDNEIKSFIEKENKTFKNINN